MSKSPETRAQAVEHLPAVRSWFDHDVRRDHVQARGDRPDVEVVDFQNARRGAHVIAHGLEVDAAWGRLQEHVHGRAEKSPGARQDQQADEGRGDGIGGAESRHRNGHRGNHDGGHAGQIAHHFEIGAAQGAAARESATGAVTEP
jgi:hypothetical protein